MDAVGFGKDMGNGEGSVLVRCLPLRRLTIDHASLSRRSTVPTPKQRHLLGAFTTFFPCVTYSEALGMVGVDVGGVDGGVVVDVDGVSSVDVYGVGVGVGYSWC